MRWYVLRSKPRKEGALQRFARQNGHEVFFPSIPIRPVNPRAARIRPYFPGYLFVRADLDDVGIGFLQWAPGAANLIQFGGEPAIVPEAIVAQLKRRLEEIHTVGDHVLSTLQPGDRVRIVNGPLAGYRGIFDLHLSGDQRVRILLELLEHSVAVEISAAMIEKM